MKKTFTFILFYFLFFSNLSAQQDYQILFSSGTITPTENVREFAENAVINANENYDGYYYRMIQFYDIPTNAQHQEIQQSGIELLEYLPHRAYIVAIPNNLDPQKLIDLNVRAVLEITPDFKIATDLQQQPFGYWADRGDRVAVQIKYYKNIEQRDLLLHLKVDGIEVEMANGYNNFLQATIEKDKVNEIAALPYISYLELIPMPGEAEDDKGRALHRANLLDASYAGGRSYDGEGVSVLVRDDGIVDDHIDFQGRLRQEFVNDFDDGTHGEGVAGIMAGAGNFNPKNRGMAAGAEIHVLDYVANHLDETMSLHFNDDVIVTNSSYSNGCGAGYTTIAQTVDQQIFDNPTLLHVFSAGNSNNQECGYGAGDQWGNITGGHKQGKNVIATANLNFDATIATTSSRGPATDGRIKPDISAHGRQQVSTTLNNGYQSFGGTSAAAPGIAGVIAQLHHAHRDLNGGTTAESALLKAMVLNTANDIGNVGPDYIFGWGHINGYRAIRLMEEEQYFKASVEQGSIQTHELVIPENVRQAKVMIYWSDDEGSTFATKALVNNLDARLVDTDGNVSLPWVLNSFPDPDSLDLPATTGIDDLNNVEQIAINNPVAGTYSIEVEGTEIPFGAHEYYVVYEFYYDDVKLIYPVGGEGFFPGQEEVIHWDAFGDTVDFILEYSIDAGVNWDTITTVDGGERLYEWDVPIEFTGQARVRVSRDTMASMSEANFSIARHPVGLQVKNVCEDHIELRWGGVAGVTEYRLFQLGEKYMEEIATTPEKTYRVYVDPATITDIRFFAVSTLGENGLESRRSTALFYNGNFPVDDLTDANFDFEPLNDFGMEFTNTSLEGDDYFWDFGDGNTSTDENPIHVYANSGAFEVMLVSTNPCGSDTTMQIVDAVSTSIFDVKASFELTISPNPNNGTFEIVLETNESDELNWNLYNLQGKSMREGNLSVSPGVSRQVIDGKNLSPGIYYLKIQNEIGFQTTKVMIQ
ncbi:MAG: S8 family serine peptidase [Saprospiraceae bacterium]